MKRRMKFMPMLLAVALVVAVLPTAAFAANDNTAIDAVAWNVETVNAYLANDSLPATKATAEKVDSDMKLLQKLGIVSDTDQIKEIEIVSKEEITYLTKIGNYENGISIHPVSDGVEMRSTQGSIVSVVTFCDDGSVYLNGELVTVQDNDTIDDDGVMPLSGEYWQEGVPYYGKETDYKYEHNSASMKDIELANTIANVTASAFVGAVASAILTGGAAIAGSVATAFLLGFYDYATTQDPLAAAMSYRECSYTVKSGTGYIDANYGYQYQYILTMYTRKNFSGFEFAETWYYMVLPYA